MTPIRAIVLDDSAICRNQLKKILEADRDIQVVGEGCNGDGVLTLIRDARPKVLIVDLQMPGTNGQQTIEHVMANQPLPILVVTGQPAGVRRDAVFEAIRRGALELAEKPQSGDLSAEVRLRALVRQLSTVPVVRHIAGRLQQRSVPPDSLSFPTPQGGLGPAVVGVGASAGGPFPLATLLGELPEAFPAAVAIVQHLPIGFTAAFAEYVQSRVRLPVHLVNESVRIEAGHVYIAGDDQHLVALDRRHFGSLRTAPVQGHRPAVDELFRSLASHFGQSGAAVLLSGIGKDGVDGMLAMKRSGSLTIAQDALSCGVFGMPRAALEAGAAQHALPPLSAAELLQKWAADLKRRSA